MKPNTKRAKNAIIFLYICVLTALVKVPILIFFSFGLNEKGNLLFETVEDYNQFAVIQTSIFSLDLLATLICGVFFILWFHRAYSNLHQLVPSSKLKYGASMAIWSWIIPVFNLFGPYYIASDLFNRSEGILIREDLADSKWNYHLIKGAWWFTWIFPMFITRLGIAANGNLSIVIAGRMLAIAGYLTTAACGFLAIKMIKNYTDIERTLRQLEVGTNAMELSDDDILDSGL